MKKVSALSIFLFLFSMITLPSAHAAPNVSATGTNPGICDQTVGNTTGVVAYRISGGDCVVEFRNAGSTTWTSPALLSSVQVLVVGGGGGGGARHSGGGGGGGIIYATSYGAQANTSYSLFVGAGGAGAAGITASGGGRAGQQSYFAGSSGAGSLVANGGGGGGGGNDAVNALNYDGTSNASNPRGSGGGSNFESNPGGTANPGLASDATKSAGSSSVLINGITATINAYGQAGAAGRGSGNCLSAGGTYNGWCGGGGGGASAVGASPAQPGGGSTVWIAGKGGDGQSISITGTATTFAGGGGGGAGSNYQWFATNADCKTGSPSAGSGGSGGGGAGAQCQDTASSGTANRGGGGGGAGLAYVSADTTFQQGVGGAGGSGIVIIRYTPDSVAPTISAGATANFAENTAITTNATTIVLSESSTITLSSSSDGSLFSIIIVDTATARVRFLSSPDYENPTDTGRNNVYDIVINAVDLAGNSANLAVTITVTNVNESSSINAPSVSGTIYKGVNTTISVTTNVTGKVRFYVGGKRISTCKDRVTSGTYPNNSASCTWKPPVTGKQLLTATVTPTDNTFSPNTSDATSVWVFKRTTTR